ncbi:hypothetical protein FACS189449_11530 [Alphaproteobacteria bacterium]|nr:hypothetical protein FACS189449_11530 [Alphaproteobacteria bacterium]
MQLKSEKFLLFFLLLLLCSFAHAYCDIDYDATTDYTCVEGKISCDVVISAPNGWKIPRAPAISIAKSENLREFIYDENQTLEQINNSTCKVNFQINVSDIANRENLLELCIECPMCNDICVISSKNIKIHFDYSPQNKTMAHLAWILLLGFLGGLILNVMPCVLPVLLMKLKSLFSAHKKSALLGSICGNYFSFLVLAIILAILKIGGKTIGWGLHFQNVWFLKFVTIGLFGLTLHAFGIIAFFPSIQIENEPRNVFLRNFVFSFIASITAIPCTAPFLGTAAAFAIQGTILEMFLIFFAIATGFSFPYIASVMLAPFINYDSTLARISAHGAIATLAHLAAWGNRISVPVANIASTLAFLWIFILLCNHLSPTAFACYVLVFSSCAMVLSRKCGGESRRISIVLFSIVILLAIPHKHQLSPKHQSMEEISQKISAEIANNKVVLLNISADWCVNCKYNKMNLLNDSKVQEIFGEKNVVYMEADLTEKNDDILRFIHKNGRVGIPFMMIYGPAAPNGILLSEIPMANELLNAIKKANGA